ncbi:MAG: low-specificity L-threonine aldolase [Clostridiales bacterium]|nr:low-specificity L-threonine aldolase [Clostridiales bacterium]
MKVIDIRSDTVTKPTEEMRMAMYRAEVGDDVCGDDPTVIELEKLAAESTGKEAAIFVPSGTFGNQLALFTHCNRGSEVILDNNCHIVEHEAGASSVIAGVQLRTAVCPEGVLSADDIDIRIRKVVDQHFPKTGLICMENTHSSGRVISLEKMKAVYDKAHEYNIPVHLDGARLFNAAVSLNIDASEITQYCDSVMFCLSKGLGAPIGSILAGSKEFIEKARFKRKIMGGGMRQAGVIAAPGIIALTKMVRRLKEDHQNAKMLADMLDDIKEVNIFKDMLDINMIFFTLDVEIIGENFVNYFSKRNIKVYPPEGNVFRFVMNYDVCVDDLPFIAKTLSNFIRGLNNN